MAFAVKPLLCSLLIAASYAVPTDLKARSAAPILPKEDPWYAPPDNDWQATAPGTILKMRTAVGNLTTVIANSSAAYNILYRSTNSLYEPTWAVTTLFVPTSASTASDPSLNSPNANNRLLSYQIPYDSADLNASPSYGLYVEPPADIALGLGQGWWVSVPDYEGPLAAYSAGVNSGHATLDGVRAVLSAGHGLVPETRYAMWGYSGGSIASEWAAELQVQYAPELDFVGTALGGLVPNGTATLMKISGTAFAGLLPGAIVGLTIQYPDIYVAIQSELNPTGEYNATTFLSVRNMTLDETVVTFAGQDIANYFVNGLSSLYNNYSDYVTYRDAIMGYHGIPAMPLFVYKAIGDEISAVEDTDTLVNEYCGVGANIWYQRNTVGGHEAEEVNGDGRAFEWLTAVFDGDYTMTGCLIEDVTVAIDTTVL